MANKGISEQQANRLLERIQQKSFLIDIIEKSTHLLKEMEDNDFKDMQGMLKGNKG